MDYYYLLSLITGSHGEGRINCPGEFGFPRSWSNLGRNDPPHVTYESKSAGSLGNLQRTWMKGWKSLKGRMKPRSSPKVPSLLLLFSSPGIKGVKKKPGLRKGARFEPRWGRIIFRYIHCSLIARAFRATSATCGWTRKEPLTEPLTSWPLGTKE